MTIGNRTDAENALRYARSDKEFPGRDDFQTIGIGSRRRVIIHIPTQIVYKIDVLWNGDADEYGNDSEVRACTRLAGIHQHPDIPCDVEIPEVTAYGFSRPDCTVDTVVAMAYYGDDGYFPMLNGYIRDVFYKAGWSDLFEANWRWFEGRLVIIDCGSFRGNARPLCEIEEAVQYV